MPLFMGFPEDYGAMLEEIDKRLSKLGSLKAPGKRLGLYNDLKDQIGNLNMGDRKKYTQELKETWESGL